MEVNYAPEAAQELSDAAIYIALNSGSLDAARRFSQAVRKAEILIAEFPNAHPPMGRGFRRCLLTDFPYQIVYRVDGERIDIYAVSHCKRRPGYWRKRVLP